MLGDPSQIAHQFLHGRESFLKPRIAAFVQELEIGESFDDLDLCFRIDPEPVLNELIVKGVDLRNGVVVGLDLVPAKEPI